MRVFVLIAVIAALAGFGGALAFFAAEQATPAEVRRG